MPDIFGRERGGSPAQAGIGPRTAARGTGSTRFPRAGGDRPYYGLDAIWSVEVPPRRRG